jgi:hypothetical protein
MTDADLVNIVNELELMGTVDRYNTIAALEKEFGKPIKELRLLAREKETNMKSIKIPKDIEVARVANPEVEDAKKAVAVIGTVNIISHSGLENAVAAIADVKRKHDEVDAKRRSFVDPLRKVVEDINEFFNPALEALSLAEQVLKSKVVGYVDQKMTEHDEILGSVSIDDDQAAKEAAQVKAGRCVPPKISGMAFREGWSGKVTDMDALVRWAIDEGRLELLKVDEKALKALTKSAGRDPGIPGWEAGVARSVAITVSKIKT